MKISISSTPTGMQCFSYRALTAFITTMKNQENDGPRILNEWGSVELIEKTVEDYYQALYRFAYSLTKSQHEAADLTQ